MYVYERGGGGATKKRHSQHRTTRRGDGADVPEELRGEEEDEDEAVEVGDCAEVEEHLAISAMSRHV